MRPRIPMSPALPSLGAGSKWPEWEIPIGQMENWRNGNETSINGYVNSKHFEPIWGRMTDIFVDIVLNIKFFLLQGI